MKKLESLFELGKPDVVTLLDYEEQCRKINIGDKEFTIPFKFYSVMSRDDDDSIGSMFIGSIAKNWIDCDIEVVNLDPKVLPYEKEFKWISEEWNNPNLKYIDPFYFAISSNIIFTVNKDGNVEYIQVYIHYKKDDGRIVYDSIPLTLI